jgi:hypothetical protein
VFRESLFVFIQKVIFIYPGLSAQISAQRKEVNEPARCGSFLRDMSGRYASRALSSAEKSVENTKISLGMKPRRRRAYRAYQRATISIMAEGGGSSGRDRRVHRDGRPLRRLHRPDCSGAFPRSRKNGGRDAARRGAARPSGALPVRFEQTALIFPTSLINSRPPFPSTLSRVDRYAAVSPYPGGFVFLFIDVGGP